MTYEECGKVVDAVRPLLKGTGYDINYDLGGEIYFTLEGDVVEFYELPLATQIKVYFAALNKLDIRF